MMYYRCRYVQKGHGLCGIFRSVAKIFSPLARNVVRAANNPEVKNILKTVGEEAMDTGKELLINSLRGRTSQSQMKEKINKSKKRISDSIEEGIAALREKRKSRKYKPLIEDISNDESLEKYRLGRRGPRTSNLTKLKIRRSKRNVKYESVFD